MPTIGIYVPTKVYRGLAARWEVELNEERMQEIVRIVCADALEQKAGILYEELPFSSTCQWRSLHRAGTRCRHCGGSE